MQKQPESKNLSRYVIQEHQTSQGIHWDLMIQQADCLWTWRMNCPPDDIRNTSLPLEKIADHPLRFLTYEGPVQNGTASVRIADHGTAEINEQTKDSLIVTLNGQHLKAQFTLHQTNTGPHWTLSRR